MSTGDPVDECLQPGPAVEAVGARQYQLRVVQRERRRIDAAEVSLHLGDRGGVAQVEGVEQFLRLAFELIENGTRRQAAGVRMGQAGHDELLSWPRVRGGRRAVSARSGRKEFIERSIVVSSGGLSPVRGHGSALTRSAQNSMRPAAPNRCDSKEKGRRSDDRRPELGTRT